jgi:hypothetical protein
VMKYMIMMLGGLGATMQDRTPEWISGMHELMMTLDTELKESGEVVASHGLVDPSQAKTVRSTGGVPVPRSRIPDARLGVAVRTPVPVPLPILVRCRSARSSR